MVRFIIGGKPGYVGGPIFKNIRVIWILFDGKSQVNDHVHPKLKHLTDVRVKFTCSTLSRPCADRAIPPA